MLPFKAPISNLFYSEEQDIEGWARKYITSVEKQMLESKHRPQHPLLDVTKARTAPRDPQMEWQS